MLELTLPTYLGICVTHHDLQAVGSTSTPLAMPMMLALGPSGGAGGAPPSSLLACGYHDPC